MPSQRLLGDILLYTVAIDGNKCVFPLVIAIVEIENREIWIWFLYWLYEALLSEAEICNSYVLIIMFD